MIAKRSIIPKYVPKCQRKCVGVAWEWALLVTDSAILIVQVVPKVYCYLYNLNTFMEKMNFWRRQVLDDRFSAKGSRLLIQLRF
jgi:hypothetical protein